MSKLKAVLTAIALSLTMGILTPSLLHAEQQPTMQFIASIMTDNNGDYILDANGDMQVSIRPSTNGWIEREHEPGCYQSRSGYNGIVCLKMKSNADGLPPDGGIPAPRTWRPDPAALAYLQRLRGIEDNPLLKKNEANLQQLYDDCVEMLSKDYVSCRDYVTWSANYMERWRDYPQERNLMAHVETACDKSGFDKSMVCIVYEELEDLYDACYTLDAYHGAVPPCTLYNNQATGELSNKYRLNPESIAAWRPARDSLNRLEDKCTIHAEQFIYSSRTSQICTAAEDLEQHYDSCLENRWQASRACMDYRNNARTYTALYQHYPPNRRLLKPIKRACGLLNNNDPESQACKDQERSHDLASLCSTFDLNDESPLSSCNEYADIVSRYN